MEADFLRLILLLVGIVAVLIVYFWERHKRVNAQVDAIRSAEQQADKIRKESEFDNMVVTDEYRGDAAPALETPGEEQPDKPPWLDDNTDDLSHELDQLSELVAEESRLDYAEQIPLFSTDESEESLSTNSTESKVIVINVVSHKSGFNGEAILAAAAEAGMEPGEMDIFHYCPPDQGQKKRAQFCMASMVEPGTFPLDTMDEFVTPGLALFLQIAGGQGGLARYDEMLITAGKLAESLDGELQDATHSTLTRQVVEFQREEIIEFQRQQMLAKSNK